MDANASLAGILSPFGLNITGFVGEFRKKDDLVDIFERFTEEQKTELYMYRIFAYTVGSLIIFSNLIVVVSSGLILKKGSQCKSTFILLGNVSLADTLIGCNVIFGISIHHDAVSHAMCIFQIGLIVCPTLVSIFSVGLIAVDRYIYILHGLHYRRWINTTRVRLCIILIWMLGIILGFMPATGWSGDTLDGKKCWYITIAPPGLITLISIIGFLPIITVVILYSIILFTAIKNVTQLQSGNEQAKRYHEKEPELRINRGNIEKTPVKIQREINSSTNSLSIHTIASSVESGLSALAGAEENSADPEGNKFRNVVNKIKNIEKTPEDPIQRDINSSTNSLSIHTIASSVESGLSALSDAEANTADLEGNKFRSVVNKMKKSIKDKRKRDDKPNKWRAVKVVLLTTGSFVCTWVPYFIASIMYILCDKATDKDRCLRIEVALASPLAILGLINSLLNPLIYAWWHRGFKTAAKKIYCLNKSCGSRIDSLKPSSQS